MSHRPTKRHRDDENLTERDSAANDAAVADTLVASCRVLRPRKPKEKLQEVKVEDSTRVDQAARRRPAKRRRKGAQIITELPLEMLYEIFSYLRPLELLHLARTNKTFRNFLMSKNRKEVWQIARMNGEDIPKCPDDMSEPAWANLLFCHRCHFCLRSCVAVDWMLRERACSKCAFTTVLPTPDGSYSPDRTWEDGHASAIKPIQDIAFFDHDSIWRDILSLPLPGFEQLAVMRKDERKITPGHVSTFLEYFNKLDDEKKTKVEEQHNARKRKIRQHARRYERWYAGSRAARAIELDFLRQKRLDSILEKLDQMGLMHEMQAWPHDFLDDMRNLREVNQPKELTERIWQNIKPAILGWYEQSRVIAQKLREGIPYLEYMRNTV